MDLAHRLKPLVGFYEGMAQLFLYPILRYEWKHPRYKKINERSVEYAFALESLAQACPEHVLDVGAGKTSWPHLLANCGYRVTAIDKVDGYWKGPLKNRHFYVKRGDIVHPAVSDPYDFVTCISVLEHIPDHGEAVRGMFNLLKPGGHLLLTFPYNENRYVPDVYRVEGSTAPADASFICQVYSREQIDGWLAENPGTILRQEYHEVFTGGLWTLGNRIYPVRPSTREGRHHLSCLLIRKDG